MTETTVVLENLNSLLHSLDEGRKQSWNERDLKYQQNKRNQLFSIFNQLLKSVLVTGYICALFLEDTNEYQKFLSQILAIVIFVIFNASMFFSLTPNQEQQVSECNSKANLLDLLRRKVQYTLNRAYRMDEQALQNQLEEYLEQFNAISNSHHLLYSSLSKELMAKSLGRGEHLYDTTPVHEGISDSEIIKKEIADLKQDATSSKKLFQYNYEAARWWSEVATPRLLFLSFSTVFAISTEYFLRSQIVNCSNGKMIISAILLAGVFLNAFSSRDYRSEALKSQHMIDDYSNFIKSLVIDENEDFNKNSEKVLLFINKLVDINCRNPPLFYGADTYSRMNQGRSSSCMKFIWFCSALVLLVSVSASAMFYFGYWQNESLELNLQMSNSTNVLIEFKGRREYGHDVKTIQR